ncbi:MAG: PLP-dependent cysteine synthase family protein, partial [Nitrospinota bacterium]
GAEVVLTDPLQGSDGARREVKEIYDAEPERYFMPGQYDNPANPKAHFETTGVEIFRQTRGRITHLIAGIGTGGTLMGTGARLRALNPEVKVIAVEPEEPLHGIEGLKHMPTSIKPQIYDENFPDQLIPVSTMDAYSRAEELAASEGLFVGHSSGAAVEAALRVAASLKEGLIVAICPDGGSRYISR